jgi:hypothetical protein
VCQRLSTSFYKSSKNKVLALPLAALYTCAMNLHTWLDSEKGRTVWLAEKMGRTPAAVSFWRNNGVPLPLIPRVAELTGHAVTTDEMLRFAMEKRTGESSE